VPGQTQWFPGFSVSWSDIRIPAGIVNVSGMWPGVGSAIPASMCGRPGRCEYGGMFSASWICRGTVSGCGAVSDSAYAKTDSSTSSFGTAPGMTR
jgi:hypothetical protein